MQDTGVVLQHPLTAAPGAAMHVRALQLYLLHVMKVTYGP